MNIDKFGQHIYTENDIFDIIMSDIDNFNTLDNITIDHNNDNINKFANKNFVSEYIPLDISVEEFDKQNQSNWYMPDEYKQMDIAKHILGLCKSDVELQRVGEELLLYMEHDLFDLLKYLKYLVDVMEENNIIWGVGRGSSVSSYVLYLLKVHKVDSIYFDLDVTEFLR
jgi:DNA polymerase III alpha subunit